MTRSGRAAGRRFVAAGLVRPPRRRPSFRCCGSRPAAAPPFYRTDRAWAVSIASFAFITRGVISNDARAKAISSRRELQIIAA
jgi:hypothetical protein